MDIAAVTAPTKHHDVWTTHTGATCPLCITRDNEGTLVFLSAPRGENVDQKVISQCPSPPG